MPEPIDLVPEKNYAVRQFLLRYWTEMTDAGMPLLALVLQMLMPTYVYLCSRFLIRYAEMYMMIKN
jgi:hypothetical protein